MTGSLPLLRARRGAVAWHDGSPIDDGRFVGAALRLAERLPMRARPVNLCRDRLAFALAFTAALLRGQTSLLPPNALPATLAQLPPSAPGEGELVALVDAAAAPELEGLELPQVTVDWRALDPGAGFAEQPMPRIPAALDAACLLTSGSTGAPQPHRRTFASLVSSVEAEAERLAELIGRPSLEGFAIVATVPAQHSYGFESSVMLALHGGAAFDSARPFYPADIAAALAALPRPRALVTTPFHLKALLGAALALPAVDLVLSATAPLSPQLAAEAEAALQGPLAEIYGCTEAGQVAARRTTAGQTWTTLGDIRLRREADPASDAGERFVAQGSPVPQPTPLADVLALHADSNGRRFELLGRANDLIHVAGKRSSLAHLNFHLNRIDGVEDGAFYMPEAAPAEVARTVAFVVAPRLSAAQITAALRRSVEGAFVPRRVVHVPALPREATGKLTAGALRELAAAHLDARVPLVIPDDHPAFAGHFPGRPVLPGAALLALVEEAAARRLPRPLVIAQAKFQAPVGPGERLLLVFDATATGLTFELSATQPPRVVARGRFDAAAGAAAAG